MLTLQLPGVAQSVTLLVLGALLVDSAGPQAPDSSSTASSLRIVVMLGISYLLHAVGGDAVLVTLASKAVS